MNDSISTNQFQIGDDMIYKHEISMNLATDDFRFVTLEQQWSDELTARIFDHLGDITQRLTDDDCQAFIDGVHNSIHDSELLYRHVTGFTHKMLEKWGVETMAAKETIETK